MHNNLRYVQVIGSPTGLPPKRRIPGDQQTLLKLGTQTVMSTTTTAKAAHATPKAATAPFETAAFQEFAEKSVSTARDGYAKLKSAADDATGLVEDTFETARKGAFTIGVKALDATQANSDASFAFAKDLFGAKTLSEVIELQSTFARKQFDAFAAQFKEFQSLTEKLVTETTKPVTDQVEKTFKDLKVV